MLAPRAARHRRRRAARDETLTRLQSRPTIGGLMTAIPSAPLRVAFLGFSDSERSSLASYFRLALNRMPRFEPVYTLTDAHYLVADADHGPSVQLVLVTERLAQTVFIGSQSPPGAAASMMRPIDALRVMRALEGLVGLPESGTAALPEVPPQVEALPPAPAPVSAPAPAARGDPAAPAPPSIIAAAMTLTVQTELAGARVGPEPQPPALLRQLPQSPQPTQPAAAMKFLPEPMPLAQQPPGVAWPVPPPRPAQPAASRSPPPVVARSPTPSVAPLPSACPAGMVVTRDAQARPAMAAAAGPNVFVGPPPPPRALLVDDSAIALRFLESRLKPWGLRTDLVGNSQLALERLAQRSYDLVFLDLELGPASELDGLALCRQIKLSAAAVNSVLVMVSAHHSEIDRARGALAGCDAYLAKPLKESDLARLLKRQGLTPPPPPRPAPALAAAPTSARPA